MFNLKRLFLPFEYWCFKIISGNRFAGVVLGILI